MQRQIPATADAIEAEVQEVAICGCANAAFRITLNANAFAEEAAIAAKNASPALILRTAWLSDDRAALALRATAAAAGRRSFAGWRTDRSLAQSASAHIGAKEQPTPFSGATSFNGGAEVQEQFDKCHLLSRFGRGH